MTLIIAGERSGVGKTTVTLALLAFLCQRVQRVQSFKVGPDYIDPMFHKAVTGLPCHNLDPVLTSEAYVQQCFYRHCQGADYALVEGVMGLFDGIAFPSSKGFPCHDFASTAHIARLLNVSVLLVIDCARLSGSVAAIVHGYSSLDPQVKIAGVVLNRVGSKRHLQMLKDALEPLGLPILGIFYRQDKIAIPDRHLGLVPTAELQELPVLLARLAQLAQDSFAWDHLLPLLQTTAPIPQPQSWECASPQPVKIALACDLAFSFYYQDNLDILQDLGAQLIPWSPLEDKRLPADIQGIYFGGGFPEVFAQQLASNKLALESVYQAVKNGIPTYAECGGLMYLCEQIVDFNGQAWQMVGIIPTVAVMEKRLTLGYRQAQTLVDSPFISKGETVWGHEFHRSRLTQESPQPLFTMKEYRADSPVTTEGWAKYQLHASYLHLHFGVYRSVAEQFVAACQNYSLTLRR